MNEYDSMYQPEMRSAVYCWFSGLLGKELTEEQIRSYQTGEGREWITILSSFSLFSPWLDSFAEYLQRDDTKRVSLDLACEFGRLFLGAGGMKSVPPYESVFTSESALTYQQAETDARAIMAEYGLGVSSEFTESCDHLAVLLEFMGVLCTEHQVVEEPRVSLARQQAFINDHLLNWIPEFVKMCTQVEPEGFYSLVVRGLLSFLEADATEIHLALTIPREDNPITMYLKGERV